MKLWVYFTCFPLIVGSGLFVNDVVTKYELYDWCVCMCVD